MFGDGILSFLSYKRFMIEIFFLKKDSTHKLLRFFNREKNFLFLYYINTNVRHRKRSISNIILENSYRISLCKV